MENINAEHDYQSNDFQRSVNYDNESSRRTQLNSTPNIPHTLLVETTLEDLAIIFGCTVENLIELNPQYTADDKIPAGKIVQLPDNSALQNTDDHDNVNTIVPSVTNEINDDLKKELANRPVEVEEEGSFWDWVGSFVVDMLIEIALEATGLDIIIEVVKTAQAILAGDWEKAAELAKNLAKKALAKAIPLGGRMLKLAERLGTAAELTEAASEGNWQKVGEIVVQEAINEAAEKAAGQIQKQIGTWKGEMQQGIVPVIPPHKSNKNIQTVVVDARLSKLKEDTQPKMAIPQNNNQTPINNNNLAIPEREKELVELDNKPENKNNAPNKTPKLVQKTPEKTNTNPEKTKTPSPSYSDRILEIQKDAQYLSKEDKERFDAIASTKHIVTDDTKAELTEFEGKIQQKKATLSNSNVNLVIAETQANRKDYTSKYFLTEDEALDAGLLWVGKKHTRIDEGIYRSDVPNPDGTYNQYRMEKASLAGEHNPNVSHVHLEIIKKNTKSLFKNLILLRGFSV